jgi:predicted dehydrogenase
MKLALIGCGGRLSGLVGGLLTHQPGLRICGVLDPDPQAIARLPEPLRADARLVGTLPELLATAPDAVAIGTRCNLHAPYATALAATGLPILLEKPVATSLAQATELERAFDRSRSRVVVSFPLRYTPLYLRAKDILRSPAFGRSEHILAVNYVSYGEVYFASWYKDHAVTQGLFLQKATHDLDYLMDAVGAPIVRVAAMASHGRVYRDAATRAGGPADAHYHPGIGSPEGGMNEDSSSALLEFADGTRGVYTQVFFSRRRAERRGATFSSYAGTLSFDWYQRRIDTHWHQQPFSDSATIDETVAHWGGDHALTRHFIDVVEHGAASRSPLSAGLASVYACLAAKQSSETGTFAEVRRIAADLA